jgi:hypothetical protein
MWTNVSHRILSKAVVPGGSCTRMPPAIVDRIAGCRKVGVGECSIGCSHRSPPRCVKFVPDWAETEPELGTLIAGTDVFRGSAQDSVWTSEACQCCEDAACSLLAGEAMAYSDEARLTFNLDAKLPTVARSRARRHRVNAPAPLGADTLQGSSRKDRSQRGDATAR